MLEWPAESGNEPQFSVAKRLLIEEIPPFNVGQKNSVSKKKQPEVSL